MRFLSFLLVIMLLLAACAPLPTATPAAHAGHAMPEVSETPFDAGFIDAMIVHHEGAIAMAKQVLVESERPELRDLAEAILAAQTAEIEQMKTWRSQWYPDLPATAGLAMEMGPMEVAADDGRPFDVRFLEAMIPHHEGAIAMAQAALEQAEHAEIKELAAAIVAAQEAEIAQMQEWLQTWATP